MTTINTDMQELFESRNLDIRDTNYRFMDQKVTPDVLAFIADCILNLPNETSSFTKNDIWRSSYFTKNVVLMFNKPDAQNVTSEHEYDKFTAQPLKTLAYAGVLEEELVGGSNQYTVNHTGILEYIFLSDKNAFNFLVHYISAVLVKSGFYRHIQRYIDSFANGGYDKTSYEELKATFESFIVGNTRINTTVEIRRIFPKVLNPLAVNYGIPGSKGGYMSEGRYAYSDLMYNAVNFRDLGKLKNVSRQEALQVISQKNDYSNYEMRKAMDAIRKRHNPNSEVRDNYAAGMATQVHHIFPQSSHPQLKSSLENLILLTPQQHNTLAHPGNRTAQISLSYQLECLLSKIESVKHSELNNESFYSKRGLLSVIKIGLGLTLNPNISYEDLANQLRQHYLGKN